MMKLFFSVSAAVFFVLAALSETEFATNIFGAFKTDIRQNYNKFEHLYQTWKIPKSQFVA